MAAEYKARVAGRIREARERKGLSQSSLARLLPGKVDGPSISRWERAIVAPKPDTLEALATALDVDVSYFLVAEPEPGTPDLMAALGAAGDATQLDRIEAAQATILGKLDEVLAALGGDDPGEVAETITDELLGGDDAAAAAAA
jgi:transcriptional regulator with XRE-family HTH domain